MSKYQIQIQVAIIWCNSVCPSKLCKYISRNKICSNVQINITNNNGDWILAADEAANAFAQFFSSVFVVDNNVFLLSFISKLTF